MKDLYVGKLSDHFGQCGIYPKCECGHIRRVAPSYRSFLNATAHTDRDSPRGTASRAVGAIRSNSSPIRGPEMKATSSSLKRV
jgi:hypothetical protein